MEITERLIKWFWDNSMSSNIVRDVSATVKLLL